MPTALPARLRADLTAALKARDAVKVSVLRTTLAAIENASAVDADGSLPRAGLYANDVDRRLLSEHEVSRIVAGQRDELRAAATELRRLGQHDRAATLDTQATILERYVP